MALGASLPNEEPVQLSTTPPDFASVRRGRGASNAPPFSPSLASKPSMQSFTSNHSSTSNGAGGPGLDHGRRPSFTPTTHARQQSQAPALPSLLRANTGGPILNPSSSNHTVHPSLDRTAITRAGASVDLGAPSRTQPGNGEGATGLKLRHERSDIPKQSVDIKLAPAISLQHDVRSVGEFAQEHLFSQFKRQADDKINQYMSSRLPDQDLHIDRNFGQGADSKFDQLLTAIGHSASRNPSSFIDKVTLWHREVIENARDGRPESRHDVPRERKTSLAIYLLCRALLEILRQTSSYPLARPELDRLEELIYERHFRVLCREGETRAPAVQAKWDMIVQVTATLFDLDFEAMSDRALRDLRSLQDALADKGNLDSLQASEASQLLRGLRVVRLQAESEIAWSRSCKFLQAIGDLFGQVHGQVAKDSYCRFLGQMLLPIAGSSRRDFSQLQWKKLVQTLHGRLTKMAAKPKYWHNAFSVQAILACVSPDDIFMRSFKESMLGLPGRLRERNNRATAIKAFCRLAWVYLERTSTSPEKIADMLRDAIKTVFFTVKRYSIAREPVIAEPLVHLIRVIGHRIPDFCFKSIILPLLNYDFISAKDVRDLRPEQLDPDRSAIGIRAFLAILSDLENGQAPPFPVRFDDERRDESGALPPEMMNRAARRPSPPSTSDRLSTPVAAVALSETAREYFHYFCDMLNRIVLVCDVGFGGQAAIDDKFATLSIPKTPITGSFPRRDEAAAAHEDRNAFFELLQVGICALPRCLNGRPPSLEILKLLCNGTAHIDKNISFSSIHALKSIAKQGHAQLIIATFSSFILSYDNRCSAVSAGGTLGTDHLERTLGLYVELLKIWIQSFTEKQPISQRGLQGENGDSKPTQFGTSDLWTQVDRAECQALFFLCSPSSTVRSHAVEIFALVAKLDSALGCSNYRITTVMETRSEDILRPGDESLTLFERSVIQRDLTSGHERSPLINLCCSDHEDFKRLWYKAFPRFLEVAFPDCQVAVTQTREDICYRLAQMAPVLENLDPKLRPHGLNGSIDMTIAQSGRSQHHQLSSTLIDQWRTFLTFACKTMTKTGLRPTASSDTTHTRKGSRSSQGTAESFGSGLDLFYKVIPFLSAGNDKLREATVAGIGSIGPNLLQPLLVALEGQGRFDDNHRRPLGNHQRAASSPRRHQTSGFSVDVAHVLKMVSHHLQTEDVRNDNWIMDYFSTYTRDLSMYLHQPDIGEATQLRLHFCGLIERFYISATMTTEPTRWMSFQTRRSAFTNMEVWTGLMGADRPRASEASHQHSGRSGTRDVSRQGKSLKLQHELKIAALSSMAALCAGPVKSHSHQFDPSRLMQWVHKMFSNESDTVNTLGRRALSNLIKHNMEHTYPLDIAFDNFYYADSTKCLHSYLAVVTSVLTNEAILKSLERSKIITALLFTLTHTDGIVRMTSARLLRTLDEAGGNKGLCKLQDFDISISDRTPAVHKKAHFSISARLADAYHEDSIAIFAEFSRHFHLLGVRDRSEDQRNLVHTILPWLKNINLQLKESGGPTASSYMVLMNLLEITLHYRAPLQHEVQALWQTLVVGFDRGNVRLILDFSMQLTLDSRNSRLVDALRQIVVFLSDTPAGERLIDALLQHIAPSQMHDEERGLGPRIQAPPDAARFAHVGSIPSEPLEAQQPWDMTLGQLSLILLVDLIVAPRKIAAENIPPVLQAVLVLWDHKIDIVQEQAREMLIHLVHELIISEINVSGPVPDHVEQFIDLIRRRDPMVLWTYNENERADKGSELSKPFTYVVKELIKTFGTKYPDIAVAWGRVTLNWATTCRALHIALRSLQIYRCIVVPMNDGTVCDLIRVLSGIVADDEPERRSYAIEAMRTLRAVLMSLQAVDRPIFNQIFWAMSACLGVGYESEFSEALRMLSIVLDDFDLNEPVTLDELLSKKPPKFEWISGGLTMQVLQGVRSSALIDKTLEVLDRLIRVPSNELVGDDSRLLYVVLANTPRFLLALRAPVDDAASADLVVAATAQASVLAGVASSMGYDKLSLLLDDISARRIDVSVLVECLVQVIKAAFFPTHEFQSLLFIMGLLSNSLEDVRRESLVVLNVLTDEIDMTNPEISAAGPDLVSPLLRLLQSDLCPLALRVLDKFTAIVSLSTGRQQLHMSMANWRSSRAMRKQYDEIQSVFGIPEETGWSIGMPGKLKATTRENLARVCAVIDPTLAGEAHSLPTPEVAFYKEAIAGESYFPENGAGMVSDETMLAETSMGEMISRLDVFDDFFNDGDDDDNTSMDGVSLSRSPETTPIADTQPMTFESFSEHSASYHNRSFQSSVSSSRTRPTTPRDAGIMSPSAFKFSPQRPRPGMHRSSTSPAVNQYTPPDKTFAVSRDLGGEPFSDDDALLSGTTSDASSYYAMPRARPSLRANVKSGFRRLTGSVDKQRSMRARHAEDSPDVPKVPDMFLSNPKSAEL